MPLIKSPSDNLTVWKVEESIEELFDLLNILPEELPRWEVIKHDKRKLEWLAARCLLQEAGTPRPLHFMDNGKPFLPDGPEISLTHCKDYVAVITSKDAPVGLDIQNPDPKLKIISARYSSDDELMAAANSPDELAYLTTIWSAKEAVFKVFGEKVVFREQMHVRPFLLSDKVLSLDFIHPDGQRELFNLRVDAFEPDYNLISTTRGVLFQ